MKIKDFILLAKQLLPDFPDFAVEKQLMFISPIKHTLRGFHFDRSTDDTRFYVSAFYLPVCIPKQYLTFSLGRRLKGTGFRKDAPDLMTNLTEMMLKEALFLNSLETPAEVVKAIALRADISRNQRVLEAYVYMLARAEEVAKAIEALDRLLSILNSAILWHAKMVDRGRVLRTLLVNDPAAAHKQLDVWEMETLCNLKLEKFR